MKKREEKNGENDSLGKDCLDHEKAFEILAEPHKTLFEKSGHYWPAQKNAFLNIAREKGLEAAKTAFFERLENVKNPKPKGRKAGLLGIADDVSVALRDLDPVLEELNMDHQATFTAWIKLVANGQKVPDLVAELKAKLKERRAWGKRFFEPVFTAAQVEEMLSQVTSRLSQSHYLARQIQQEVSVQGWEANALLDLAETTIRCFLGDLETGTETVASGKTFNFLLGLEDELEQAAEVAK